MYRDEQPPGVQLRQLLSRSPVTRCRTCGRHFGPKRHFNSWETGISVMDVFEALGIDVGDNTRSLSVTDGMDQDFMQFLPTLFGWDEKDSEKNR